MRKIILALSMALTIINTVHAQYVKLYYKDVQKETDDVTIVVDNAVSTAGETKFKLKIINKTSDYIIYKPEESKFMINGAEASPKEKWLIIKPNESDFRVINLKGIYNTIKNYSFTVNGLYKVNTNGIVGAAPNFKLPASQNEFKVADFICTLSDLVKETGKTKAKFTCVYSGSKIGFIDPKKVTVKMPDGNEYSNTNISTSLLSKSPDAPMMLMNGTQENFTLIWERMQGGRAMDMQKVDMIIIWHEAFSQSTLKKINGETLQFEFDETTSNLKGK